MTNEVKRLLLSMALGFPVLVVITIVAEYFLHPTWGEKYLIMAIYTVGTMMGTITSRLADSLGWYKETTP